MNPLVSFIAPVWNFYPIMVPSVLLQTHKNVEVIIVHDGPPDDLTRKMIIDLIMIDSRIKYFETDHRYNDWGHSPREFGLNRVSPNSEFVVTSGGDSYYLPIFVSEMLKLVQPNVIGVYCDFVHKTALMNTLLVCGNIDGGCMMVRTPHAKEIGWKDRGYTADWEYINKLINKYGESNFVKLSKPYFIHN